MRHVADGDLHALLDGALDQVAGARARHVREHLDGCASCRRRLDEEAATRARAARILAGADPEVGALPPLEILRARAAGGDAEGAGPGAPGPGGAVRTGVRGSLPPLGRLAWAASVVLALGVGWLAKGGTDRRVSPAGEPFREGAAVPAGTQGPAAGPIAGVDATARDPQGVGGGPAAGPVGPGAAVPGTDPPPALADAGTANAAGEETPTATDGRGADEAVAVPTELRTAAAEAEEALESAAGSEGAGQARVLADRAAPPAAGAAPPPRAQAGAPSAGEAGLRGTEQLRVRREAPPPGAAAVTPAPPGAARTEDAPIRRGEARGGLAGPVALPGLEVVRVEWTEVAPGVEGLRILQLLAPGDTLEARFVPGRGGNPGPADPGGGGPPSPGADSDALVSAPLREGWSQVVRTHAGGLLVVRAAMGQERLEALVAQLAR